MCTNKINSKFWFQLDFKQCMLLWLAILWHLFKTIALGVEKNTRCAHVLLSLTQMLTFSDDAHLKMFSCVSSGRKWWVFNNASSRLSVFSGVVWSKLQPQACALENIPRSPVKAKNILMQAMVVSREIQICGLTYSKYWLAVEDQHGEHVVYGVLIIERLVGWTNFND